MREANVFTSCEEAFCSAMLPSSTSVMPSWAACFTKLSAVSPLSAPMATAPLTHSAAAATPNPPDRIRIDPPLNIVLNDGVELQEASGVPQVRRDRARGFPERDS